jgi:hypothetical protein
MNSSASAASGQTALWRARARNIAPSEEALFGLV